MKGDLRRMWLLVLFDLPVKKKPERKAAAEFRRHLLNDGFVMLQFSVYARLCSDQEALQKHLRRSMFHLPPTGAVRALEITDKQFARMKILLGKKASEEKHGAEQLVFL
jgi:CRISPR-associated protein Cas2